MPAVTLYPSSVSGNAPVTGGGTKLAAIQSLGGPVITIGRGGTYHGVTNPYFSATFDDWTTPSGFENPEFTIDSVTFYIVGEGDGPASVNIVGGWDVPITSFPSFGSGFAPRSATVTTKSTGVPWTISDIDSLSVDVFFPSPYTGSLDVDQFYAVVNYSVAETPNDPDGLAITAEAYNSVTLEWNDNSDVETSYEIQRSENDISWVTIATLAADNEIYVDNTVRSSTLYYYRVRAINVGLFSDWSSEVSLTTDDPSGPPAEPVDLIALAKTPTSLPVTWIALDDLAATFEVQKSPDGSTWDDAVVVDGKTPFYTYENLLPGSTYHVRVRGVNSEGNSSWTTPIIETIPERSFREFLEKEVLQDNARYLGWFDVYNLNDSIFSVRQQIKFSPNISAIDMAKSIHLSFKRDPVTNADDPKLVEYNILIALAGWEQFGYNLYGSASASVPNFTTTVKLDSPLTMDVPKGTPFAVGSYWYREPATGVTHTVQIQLLVGNDSILYGTTPDDDQYFSAPDVLGAKVGETIIKVEYKIWDGAAYGANQGLLQMGNSSDSKWGPAGYGGSSLQSGTFDVTQAVDHTVVPFNAGPIYDLITAEALLRLGYTREIDVPAEKYQQFRDAGRVEAWRAVAYATLHKQDGMDENGLYGQLSQFNDGAITQLSLSEQEYVARYETVQTTFTPPPSKPKASSYSGGVKVRF